METCYPITRPTRTAEPTTEPVTIAEARRQCGFGSDDTGHDTYLQSLITSARLQVEAATSLVCLTGSHTWKFTNFPWQDWFELPDLRPVTSITSIVYIASDGTSTTWSSSNYTLETSGVHQFVRLNYGCSWPTLRGDINGVTVTFVAGYATPAAVPAHVKNAILMAVDRDFEDPSGSDKTDKTQAYERLIRLIKTESYS